MEYLRTLEKWQPKVQKTRGLIFGFMLSFCLTLVFGFDLQADALGTLSELHVRGGLVTGSYVGPTLDTTGSFNVPSTLDVEWENHYAPTRSFTGRGTLAYETSTALMRYIGGSVGQRFYFWSSGRPFISSEGATSVKIIPKLRYYAGYDLGIGSVIVIYRGPVFQTYSTMLDFTGLAGMGYQFSENFAANFQLGYSYGYGFSSVSVIGSTFRILLGASYFLF